MSDDDLIYLYEPPLSDKEAILIGRIIALWGALESIVFEQTLDTFKVRGERELPKQMNNLNFSNVLGLWKTHVADVAEGGRAEVFKQLYTKINHQLDSRNAMIHGMWTWTVDDPEKISTMRVSKKQLITMDFPAGSLADIHKQLAVINFKIRYPGGLEDYARERGEEGFSISRKAMSMLAGNPNANDWLTLHPVLGDESE